MNTRLAKRIYNIQQWKTIIQDRNNTNLTDKILKDVFEKQYGSNAKRGCRISKFFCWAAALLFAHMASKTVAVSTSFFISTVHP